MARPRKSDPPALGRIARPLTLTAQVEQVLRQALADGRWAGGRLPTEVELAEQLGVSRETVRLAAGALEREGLLVKVRRRGTFARPPHGPLQLAALGSKTLGYLQVDFRTAR